MQANTAFTFLAENSTFAALRPIPFFFGMDGHGYVPQQFSDAGCSPRWQFSPRPHSGGSDLRAPDRAHQRPQILGAQISTSVHLSEVMPAAPMQVNYELDQSGTNYTYYRPSKLQGRY